MEKLIQGIMDFNKVAREIDAAYHDASNKLGLSDSERDILYVLSQMEASQSEVCAMTGLTKQTVNSAVKKMINAGYIEPLKGEKKEKLIFTSKGRDYAESTIAKLVAAENKIFGRWSKEEQNEFIKLNQKYLELFKEEINRF